MRNNRLAVTRGRFYSSPGSPVKENYDVKVNDDGTIVLKRNGYKDMQAHIEAQRKSTELSVIISKFLAGDETVLNRYQPVYADLTNAPKNLAESMQLMINAENAFNALPVDVKTKFGSDWRVWLAQSGSQSWMSAMSAVLPQAAQAVAQVPGQAPATSEPPGKKKRKVPDVIPDPQAEVESS